MELIAMSMAKEAGMWYTDLLKKPYVEFMKQYKVSIFNSQYQAKFMEMEMVRMEKEQAQKR